MPLESKWRADSQPPSVRPAEQESLAVPGFRAVRGFRVILASLAGLAGLAGLALSSCGGEGPVDLPPPTAVADSVVFSVLTVEPGAGALLRWQGSDAGPLPSSPEGTARPWVGYGRPFEIRWRVWSRKGAIVGHRWRPGQAEDAPWMPAFSGEDTVWSSSNGLLLENSYDEGGFGGLDCPGGPECPTHRRWASSNAGPYRLQLRSRDATGRVLSHELHWEVNYPPDTRLRTEPVEIGEWPFPTSEWLDAAGALVRSGVAPGDTVAAGGYLRVRMAGADRLLSAVDTDSFCCDLRYDDTTPSVRFQARARYTGVDANGTSMVVDALYNELSEDDTLGVVIGPVETTLFLRAADEWGRRDPTPVELHFFGGFRPRVREILPDGQDVVLLAPPDRTSRWPRNTVDYHVEAGVSRWWDIDNHRWWTVPVGNSREFSGAVYRVDLRFESGLDPRASAGTLEVAGLDLDGRARAWSYRLVTENDPENEVRERGESVDLGNFEIVSPGPGEAAVVTDAYEVFVPDLLWQLPDLFDPDGSCEDPVYCAIGAWVRQRLGLVTVEARARTTSERSYLNVSLGYVRPDPSAQRVGVSELGRVSETGRSLFPILLGIEQEGSDQPRYWPSGSDAAAR